MSLTTTKLVARVFELLLDFGLQLYSAYNKNKYQQDIKDAQDRSTDWFVRHFDGSVSNDINKALSGSKAKDDGADSK